jgi:YgiT-type zinc finger domain-containing protein
MRCDLCGQEGVKSRKVTETYGKGSDLLVINDIPMFSCPHCGESYFTAETLHEIEHIKRHRQEFAVKSIVEVAQFA